MVILYRLYQLFVAAPLVILSTIITSITIIIGCAIGKANVCSYYPTMIWGRFLCWIMFLPVKVEGRELLDEKQSYVFVANHQGSYDIFLVHGFLGRSFRWMMKKSLRKTPLIGKTCESTGQIFVDKSGPKAIRKTYEQARAVLKNGVSLVVFPEGARTFDGRMTQFRRGAFQLADELGLPVVPVTIDGCFDVLPRQRGINFVSWHPLRLIVHAPIAPEGQGPENVQRTLEQSYETIMNDLPERHRNRPAAPHQ